VAGPGILLSNAGRARRRKALHRRKQHESKLRLDDQGVTCEAMERNLSQQPLDRPSAIWIHAVSVGEVLSGVSLARRLKAEYPGRPLVVSTTTITGQALARERMPFADAVFYFPLDWTFSVRRAAPRRPAVYHHHSRNRDLAEFSFARLDAGEFRALRQRPHIGPLFLPATSAILARLAFSCVPSCDGFSPGSQPS